MRLNILKLTDLTELQQRLYDDMKPIIETKFTAFKAIKEDHTLIGPWNPWLKFPHYGGPAWEATKSVSMSPSLPVLVREIAILVIGTKFNADYELYAHVLVAESKGLDETTIATILAGIRPNNLNEDELLSYDIAAALVNGGTLAEPLYVNAIKHFGEEGTAELIFLIGNYCHVSMILNGFNIPVPD